MIRNFRSARVPLTNVISKAREARIFKKLVEKGLTKEKKVQTPKILSKSCLPSAYENEFSNRRMIVMNKVFMEKLTEMVNQMDCGKWLADLNIEITKVKVHYTFEYIDMFWITHSVGTSEKTINEALQITLQKLQERVRNMSPFRRMPILRFVRDLRLENELNLEETFKLIDFGKDFDPAHGKKVCTPGFTKNLDGLPVMRQNVLGVDVDRIKGKIMAYIKKYKAININTSGNELAPKSGLPTYKLIQFNKKDFIKHYKKKRIEALKLRKKERGDYSAQEAIQEKHWHLLNNVYREVYDDSDEVIYEATEEDILDIEEKIHQDIEEKIHQDIDEETYEDIDEDINEDIDEDIDEDINEECNNH